MSSSSDPKNTGDQGDPWEQLAEDLFGLEFGKEHGSREPSPPIAAPPVAPPPAPAPAPQPVREPVHHERVAVTSAVENPPQQSRQKPPRAVEPELSDLVFDESDSSPAVESPAATGTAHDSIPAPAAQPRPEPTHEAAAPPARSETSQPETSQPAAETVSAQDSYWDALANWNWDESEGSAGKSKAVPAEPAASPPPTEETLGGREERPERHGRRPDRGDRGRGNGGRGDGGRGGERRDDRRERRGGDRPPRRSSEGSHGGSSRPVSSGSSATGHSTPARSPQPAAPAAGDDFGLGLDEVTSGDELQPAPASHREEPRQASEHPGAESQSPRDEEGAFPKKRRRRRRRRSRGGESGAGAPGSGAAGGAGPGTAEPAAAAGDDWDDDDSAGPESEAAGEESPMPAGEPLGETRDKVEGDRHVSSRGRRGRSRHERSRREGAERRSSSDYPRSEGRGDEGSSEFDEEPLSVGGGGEGPADDSDGEDDAVDQAVSYEDVPSWEEAISYLLHPNQVQVEPGTGNGSGSGSGSGRQSSQADQPRQTRHMGGQKHHR